MISIQNISKSYADVEALKNISFDINENELFGILGPDGAGKTTLFRIMASLLVPDKGETRLNGIDPVTEYKKIRQILGYMPGRFSLYQDLSVEENLNFYATVFGTTIEENYDLIADIYKQIEPFKNRLAGRLSGGMKQKLALSCALVHKPEILLLDEPTTGVDAVSRNEFWQMLKRLQQKGITIVVSTPYMDEATLCDRVVLMQQGTVLSIDTPQGIINRFDKRLLAISSKNKFTLLTDMRDFYDTNSIFPFGQVLHYTSKSNQPNADEIRQYLQNKGHENILVETTIPDIEDCFMELMQKHQS
jgi:ABC-type multidrug transport system ATPase subunit